MTLLPIPLAPPVPESAYTPKGRPMTPHALALCAALLARPPAPAFCSCPNPATHAEAFRRAKVVFTGRAVATREAVLHGSRVRLYTFVTTGWRKGAGRDTVEVETGLGGTDCGWQFPLGREITVYGQPADAGRVYSGLCDMPLRPLDSPVAAAEDPE